LNMSLLKLSLFLAVAMPMPGSSRVLIDPNAIKSYFYQNTVPQIAQPESNHLVYIGQCYQGKAYFATLYNQNRKIPVYSAYVYGATEEMTDKAKSQPSETNIKPRIFPEKSCIELKSINENDNMKESPNLKLDPKWYSQVEESQAIDQDYRESFYSRGHMNPNGHHSPGAFRKATFTLTNAVPQNQYANEEWAKQYEDKIIRLTRGCSKTYIITGAIPGNNLLKDRVSIPEYIWSALCCVNNNGNPMRSTARLQMNKGDKNENIVKSLTVNELVNTYLKLHLQITELFKDGCQP
uniref:Endonuclease domain-containing 1 protein n=1 Tax=Latimeria chalumnae TaxID=7897 RepID=H3A375_LATCH